MKSLTLLLLLATGVCFVRLASRAHRPSDDDALIAAWNGDHVKLAELLRNGLDPDAEAAGMTLLGLAASRGHRLAVETLIRCGADADRRVPGGQTPLMLAAIAGDAAAMRALLAAGADVNATDDAGFTVLMYALISRDPARVRACVAAGADLHPGNATGLTANDIAEHHADPLVLRILAGDGDGL